MRQSGSAPVWEPATWPVWLGEVADDHAAQRRPAPLGTAQVGPVSWAVNSVRNNGPKLLTEAVDVAPLTLAEAVVDVNPA